jgi:RNA polymerase sigma-70 factor (ECF subfamily)
MGDEGFSADQFLTDQFLTDQFAANRAHLRSVAYRMLGSTAEAEDAVQESWLRVSRADPSEIDNPRAWLTTVVARVCLNLLRARTARREDSLDVRMPDPVITAADDPEQLTLVADAVGIAMLVVLDSLSPAERLAFVLYDVFGVPFDEIATIVDRSPAATRQLASRARRRVRTATPTPASRTELADQRAVVEAFLSAAHGGDLDTLVTLLDPDVVIRTNGGTVLPSGVRHGVQEVARGAIIGAGYADSAELAYVNGIPGFVARTNGRLISVAAFTISAGRVVRLDILTDPDRLARLGR